MQRVLKSHLVSAFSIDKRQKRSRQRDDEDQGDITWINEKNRQFNRKLSRYYDDVTRETRENFERGAYLPSLSGLFSRDEVDLTHAKRDSRRNCALKIRCTFVVHPPLVDPSVSPMLYRVVISELILAVFTASHV